MPKGNRTAGEAGFLPAFNDLENTQSATTTALAGKAEASAAITSAERTKLGGIATSATANSTDAQLRDRTTHTGVTPTSGLATGTAGAGKYLDGTGAWTTLPTGATPTTDASQLTSGTLPAARLADASVTDAKLAAGTSLTAAERTKLSGIATAATANRTDSAVDTLLAAKAPLTLTQSSQTGASYTPVLGDAGTLISLSNAAATTLTVPPTASVAFPAGTVIGLRQAGAGQVTVAPGAGVTIRSRGPALKLAGQWAEASLTRTATANEWVLSGDTTA